MVTKLFPETVMKNFIFIIPLWRCIYLNVGPKVSLRIHSPSPQNARSFTGRCRDRWWVSERTGCRGHDSTPRLYPPGTHHQDGPSTSLSDHTESPVLGGTTPRVPHPITLTFEGLQTETAVGGRRNGTVTGEFEDESPTVGLLNDSGRDGEWIP